jgi:hypothetical protein
MSSKRPRTKVVTEKIVVVSQFMVFRRPDIYMLSLVRSHPGRPPRPLVLSLLSRTQHFTLPPIETATQKLLTQYMPGVGLAWPTYSLDRHLQKCSQQTHSRMERLNPCFRYLRRSILLIYNTSQVLQVRVCVCTSAKITMTWPTFFATSIVLVILVYTISRCLW